MHHSRQRWLVPALAVLLAVTLLAASPGSTGAAGATSDGSISGQILMGSAGGTIDGPLTVKLASYRDGQLQDTREAAAGEGNTYSFAGLSTDAGYEYFAFVEYKGVAYGTSSLALNEVRFRTADFIVYEPTEEQAVLRVLRDTIVITRVNANEKQLTVLEIVEFENSSDRTYLPATTGGAGPMGLLRFGLPPGARDLQPAGPLTGFQLAAVDAGFATDMPLRPGRTLVSFTYQLDYSGLRGQTFRYEKALPYTTDRVTILVGDRRLGVGSPALRDAGPASIGSQTYRQYDSASGPVVGPLPVAISGLPGTFPFDLSGPAVRYAGLILATALAGLALIRGLAGRRAGGAAGGRPEILIGGTVEGAEAAEAALLLETARVDIDFERGRIPEDVYRRERAALTHRLVELLSEAPAAVAVEEKDDGGNVPAGRTTRG